MACRKLLPALGERPVVRCGLHELVDKRRCAGWVAVSASCRPMQAHIEQSLESAESCLSLGTCLAVDRRRMERLPHSAGLLLRPSREQLSKSHPFARFRRQASGRQVQVDFPKPFFGVLRSVCGPNPRRVPACTGSLGIAHPSAQTGARLVSIRRRGGSDGTREAFTKEWSRDARLR